MMPPSLEQLETKLREAAAGRWYREVTRLSAEFAEAVRAYVQTLPKGDPHAAEAVRNLDSVLSYTIVILRAARCTCLADLRLVSTANRYSRGFTEAPKPAAIRLDA